MAKRDRRPRDPEDEGRRRIIQGGLLTAAAALGFLPACGDGDGEAEAIDGSSGKGAAGAGDGASAGGAPVRAGSGGGQASAQSGRGGASAAGADAGAGTNAAGSAAGDAGAMTMADAGSMQPPGDTLPRATLGKTGVSIPILGLGTSRLGQRGGTPSAADYANMLEVFEAAMNLGIEYLDTGSTYGRAEEALGELIPSRRDKVFVVTKLYADTRAEAQIQFERSLERLKTDHVDLLHLHSVGERNIDAALAADGAWPFILEQKASGGTRFVGITGHNNPPNFLRMLATDEVDVLMTIMNFIDHTAYGLSKDVREDAVARGCGVMAMKVFGGSESVLMPGGGFATSNAIEKHPSNMQIAFNEDVLPDCMRFVKSLPGVNGMVIGINDIEEIQRNIQWAIETQPFSDTELDAIVKMGEAFAPNWAQRYG